MCWFDGAKLIHRHHLLFVAQRECTFSDLRWLAVITEKWDSQVYAYLWLPLTNMNYIHTIETRTAEA